MAPKHQLLELPLSWEGMGTFIADSVSISVSPELGIIAQTQVKQVRTPLDAVFCV